MPIISQLLISLHLIRDCPPFRFLSCTKFSEDARDDIPAGAFLPISAFDVTSLRVVCLCAFVGVFVTKDVRPPEFI